MLPFAADLLIQEGYEEESIQSRSQGSIARTNLGGWELGGWTNTPGNWIHMIQACSTEGGADIFVDRHANWRSQFFILFDLFVSSGLLY
jgi:hypothetical protein